MKHKAEPTIAGVSDPAGERTLVVGAKNGDEQAFEPLFKRYQRKTLALVLRYTRVVEDAENIVQQSFYKAFVHLCQFQGESSFPAWLTRIAINGALMFLRRIGAVREVSIDDIRDAQGSAASLVIPDSNADPETRCSQREEVRKRQVPGSVEHGQAFDAAIPRHGGRSQHLDSRRNNDLSMCLLSGGLRAWWDAHLAMESVDLYAHDLRTRD